LKIYFSRVELNDSYVSNPIYEGLAEKKEFTTDAYWAMYVREDQSDF